MGASRSATAIMELNQRLSTFLQNAMVQKIARRFHEVFAWMVHRGLLLENFGQVILFEKD